MVQVSCSTGCAYSKVDVRVDDLVRDLSMSGAFDKVEQHQDLETVDAVHKDAPAEADVTLTEDDQCFTLVLNEDCFETVHLAAPNTDVGFSKTSL